MNLNPVPSLFDRVHQLDPRQRNLVDTFITQLLGCHDPDFVQSFLEWRSDPRIESLLDLAAALDDENRDQLLFKAEDLYTEQVLELPKARA